METQGELDQPPFSTGGHQCLDWRGPQDKETKCRAARGCWGWQGLYHEPCLPEGEIIRAWELERPLEGHARKREVWEPLALWRERDRSPEASGFPLVGLRYQAHWESITVRVRQETHLCCDSVSPRHKLHYWDACNQTSHGLIAHLSSLSLGPGMTPKVLLAVEVWLPCQIYVEDQGGEWTIDAGWFLESIDATSSSYRWGNWGPQWIRDLYKSCGQMMLNLALFWHLMLFPI